MKYIKLKLLIGSALLATCAFQTSAFSQEDTDITADMLNAEYISVNIGENPDPNIRQKLNRYINSKKKDARILNALTDEKIAGYKKRARLAGTDEAKRAALQAIKKAENELKRALYEIRNDIKNAIKRVHNAYGNNHGDMRDVARVTRDEMRDVRVLARADIKAIRNEAREAGTQEARESARIAIEAVRVDVRAEVRTSIDVATRN